MCVKEKTYYPRAFACVGGESIFTLNCRDRETAYSVISREVATAAVDQLGRFYRAEMVIDAEKIKEERIFFCHDCALYTLGKNECISCKGTLQRKGRKTFIYNF